MQLRRIGIFGGTFDPIHDAHVAIGERARDVLELDMVLFEVANKPWQKSDREVASAEDRFQMVKLALGGVRRLEASHREIDRDGESYTIDTVNELEKEFPDAELWLILGSDAAANISTWHRHEGLARSVRLAIIARPSHEVEVPKGFDSRVINMPQNSISSTAIRTALLMGKEAYGLDPKVAEFIEKRQIYPQNAQQILDL